MMKQRQKNKPYDVSYRRLDKEKESGSDSGEETELFVRSKPQRKEIPTIEKVIEDGDTLQSLAIQNHCSVAELKRLNNIHKENEIFARRTIKVPHRPFTMALAGIHTSGRSSPNTNSKPSTSRLIDIDEVSTRLNDNHLGIQNGVKDVVNEIIFNSNIVESSNRLNEAGHMEENSEEVLLLPGRERTTPETAVVSSLNCSGADADISWIALIVCIVIVIFAIPIIYVVYIAEHKEQYLQHIS